MHVVNPVQVMKGYCNLGYPFQGRLLIHLALLKSFFHRLSIDKLQENVLVGPLLKVAVIFYDEWMFQLRMNILLLLIILELLLISLSDCDLL